MDREFPRVQTWLRSFVRFGTPLINFTSAGDRSAEQAQRFQDWFAFGSYKDHLVALAAEYQPTVNITFRGGAFQTYEGLWATYKTRFGFRWGAASEDRTRYLLFKDNVKKLEYLAVVQPGADLQAMLNPYMHLTHPEFLMSTHALGDAALRPAHSTYLMWLVTPDMTDFAYPP